MAALSEIEKRHGMRCRVLADVRQVKPPVITDTESVKEQNKIIKEMQADFLEASTGVDHDFKVLLMVIRELGQLAKVDPDRIVEAAYLKMKLDEETEKIFNRRRMEEAEQRLKDAKERGEVPGQQKLFANDSSTAEPAGECRTFKIEE